MIGVIADDMTGATDVAASLHRSGLTTRLYFDLRDLTDVAAGADAVVIALKTRMAPAVAAVAQSLSAQEALAAAGATSIYFKYCSTFDSTPRGNIGPVLDALRARIGGGPTVTTPSSPEHGRTQYLGYLFVHDRLLDESPMRNHPLTPMTDSSLVRLMNAQSAGRSAVIPLQQVRAGVNAVQRAIQRAAGDGADYLFADAVEDSDLACIAAAVADSRLLAGAAGLAGALGARLAKTRAEPSAAGDDDATASTGRAAVIAGSCSNTTLEQVACLIAAGHPSFFLNVLAHPDPGLLAEAALAWFDSACEGTPLFYSSQRPDELARIQSELGPENVSDILESAMGRIAVALRDRGVRRMVIAGGETSGSIIRALGVTGGRVGSEAAPGVPWIHADGGMELLLKSGNFGQPDLLLVASESPGEMER